MGMIHIPGRNFHGGDKGAGDKINCSVAKRSSGQQVDQKKSSCLDREEIIVMGQARLLLFTLSLAYVQGCTLKSNAEDLISVGYFTYEQDTAVDRNEVKMRDEGKFENLMEDCTRKETRSKKIEVQYRAKGKTEAWKHGGKKTLHFSRKPTINVDNLNPCEAYEVQVAVGNEVLGVFSVGPFYDDEHSNVYLWAENENPFYKAYSQNPLKHIQITSDESSAKINVTGFCARTVLLEVQAEGEEATQLLLQNDLRNPQQLETILSDHLSDLTSCTKYEVILDLYLNKKATLEAANENFATFYTMPTQEGLEASFDPDTKTLSWDFTQFFQQDCANSESTNFEVSLTEGNVTEEMGIAGSKKMIANCGRDLSLHVAYDKQGKDFSRNVTVFNEFVTGNLEPTEESVNVENERLVLTVDPCLGDPEMVEFVPLSATDRVPAIKITPKELRSKLESEVGWVGCLDYEVRFKRSGKKVKELNVLKHPGWKSALDGKPLHVLTTTNSSVEMQKPKIFWEDPSIKMEVVCNVSGENYTMPKGHFEFDKTLEVTGLSSSTEYKCVARLFKDDGSSSGWSKELSVSTVETGEEAQTFPPTEAPESRSAGPSEPKSTNGGNLTFGSFISLAALVSTTLLLTTNHFF